MSDDDVVAPTEEEVAEYQRSRHRDWLVSALESDIAMCERQVEATKDSEPLTHDFACRTLVRTMFAMIEGLCAAVLEHAREFSSPGSAFEQNYTAEEKAKLGKERMKTQDAIKLALDLVGRGVPDLAVIDYCTSDGWAKMLRAIKVRDRLTHPKVVVDMILTVEDLSEVNLARAWFVGEHQARTKALQQKEQEGFAQWLREASALHDAREAARASDGGPQP